MNDITVFGVTEVGVLLTSITSEVVIEGIAGVLLILIGYHYMQLATGDGDGYREHRRRLLQMAAALGGFAYFSALLTPMADAWPVHLGTVIQSEIDRTANEIAADLARDGFVGWLYRLGLAVYIVTVTVAVVAIRIPIILWQSVISN